MRAVWVNEAMDGDIVGNVVRGGSGGQRQKAWIALALAQDTELMLLDEPTTFLDIAHQVEVLDLLAELDRREGRTIVIVLHDLNQAAEVCDTLCVLNRSLVAYGPLQETLTEDVLRQAYGVHLHLLHDQEHVDHVVDDGHHHA